MNEENAPCGRARPRHGRRQKRRHDRHQLVTEHHAANNKTRPTLSNMRKHNSSRNTDLSTSPNTENTSITSVAAKLKGMLQQNTVRSPASSSAASASASACSTHQQSDTRLRHNTQNTHHRRPPAALSVWLLARVCGKTGSAQPGLLCRRFRFQAPTAAREDESL